MPRAHTCTANTAGTEVVLYRVTMAYWHSNQEEGEGEEEMAGEEEMMVGRGEQEQKCQVDIF